MFTLSCDLGINGGFAFIDKAGSIIDLLAMPRFSKKDGPIDHYAIEAFFSKCKAVSRDDKVNVYIEKVWGQVGSGTKQLYNFGKNNGYIIALLNTHFGADINEVLPRTWQKWLFDKCSIKEQKKNGKRDTKKMTLDAILSLYPSVDFRENSRCRKAHDGIVDAVGIAVYGKELREN
jgi:hypothetical protein